MAAIFQSARDGTALCEYLDRLYKRARISATVVDTCHWSVTCDADTVRLYLHWREETDKAPRYHMSLFCRAEIAANEDDPDNNKFRTPRDRLRNIKDYAVEDRLARIKETVKNIPLPSQSPRKSPTKKPTSKGQTEVKTSSQSALDSISELRVNSDDFFQGDNARPNAFTDILRHAGTPEGDRFMIPPSGQLPYNRQHSTLTTRTYGSEESPTKRIRLSEASGGAL